MPITDSTGGDAASLPALLAQRARRASDTRLALDAGGGALVAVGALLWRPAGWLPLLCAGLCFAAYGAWGILDRELAERARGPDAASAPHPGLRAARATCVVLGAAAFVLLCLTTFALTLGTWQS